MTRKLEELVKKIQTNDPQVGKVVKSVRFGQEEYTKLEEDAVLAGAEDQFIKCFDDIIGKELLWQALKQAREQELKYLRELGVYEKVGGHAAMVKYKVTPIDTKWVDTDKAFQEEPMPIRSKVGTGQTCMREQGERRVCWSSRSSWRACVHLKRASSEQVRQRASKR